MLFITAGRRVCIVVTKAGGVPSLHLSHAKARVYLGCDDGSHAFTSGNDLRNGRPQWQRQRHSDGAF